MSAPELSIKLKLWAARSRWGGIFVRSQWIDFIKPDEKRAPVLSDLARATNLQPGPFKDRYSHSRGSASTTGRHPDLLFRSECPRAYIYIRGEFPEGAKILERAIEEARQHNFLGR